MSNDWQCKYKNSLYYTKKKKKSRCEKDVNKKEQKNTSVWSEKRATLGLKDTYAWNESTAHSQPEEIGERDKSNSYRCRAVISVPVHINPVGITDSPFKQKKTVSERKRDSPQAHT